MAVPPPTPDLQRGAGEQRLRARMRALSRDASTADTAEEILRLIDSGRLRGATGLSGMVERASQRVDRPGADRVIDVPAPLRELFPGRGLRRGSTVAIHGGTSLVLALLAGATRAGFWCAVVGMPALGPIAAAELGVDLERMALVPDPGPDWAEVVAALLDGLELVVTIAAPTVPQPVARRLSARARQRGSVLVGVGDWPGADLALEATAGTWYGLGEGRGRLRCREVTVVARGRGGAARARQVQMWLPALTGPLPMIAGQAPREAGEPASPTMITTAASA
jgi:hypothetical protein